MGQFVVHKPGNKGGYKPGRQGRLLRLTTLNQSLNYNDLVLDAQTRKRPIVRKRFQGKTDVTDDWPMLYQKIIEANPESEASLQPFRPS